MGQFKKNLKNMEDLYSVANNLFSKQFLLEYHHVEEIIIGIICLLIAVRALRTSSLKSNDDPEKSSRIFLVGASFIILGCSSLIHAIIHVTTLRPESSLPDPFGVQPRTFHTYHSYFL